MSRNEKTMANAAFCSSSFPTFAPTSSVRTTLNASSPNVPDSCRSRPAATESIDIPSRREARITNSAFSPNFVIGGA